MTKDQIIFHPQKETTKQSNQQQNSRLNNLGSIVQEIKEPLVIIETTFPFDLFPDKVVVDQERASIITKDIFGTEKIDSVLIANITDVEIRSGPFFSELSVIDKNIPNLPFRVNYLKKDEAFRIRRVIEGLMIAKQRNLDLSGLNKDQIVKMMEELGSVV